MTSINHAGRATSVAVAEFRLTDGDFRRIQELVFSRAGISIGDEKREFVYNRLARRLRALGLSSAREYLECLNDHAGAESVAFINSFTTNFTSFFRGEDQFRYLRNEVLPRLLHTRRAERRIRLWCAAAATGEEPYTIAMLMREAMPQIESWDVRLLATDIDTEVLAFAAQGEYDEARTASIPPELLNRWFVQSRVSGVCKWSASEELRSLITFKRLNLMEAWPMRGPFDVILCRNVMIYFTEETRTGLVERMQSLLAPSGHFFTGQSETLPTGITGFSRVGGAVYQKMP